MRKCIQRPLKVIYSICRDQERLVTIYLYWRDGSLIAVRKCKSQYKMTYKYARLQFYQATWFYTFFLSNSKEDILHEDCGQWGSLRTLTRRPFWCRVLIAICDTFFAACPPASEWHRPFTWWCIKGHSLGK